MMIRLRDQVRILTAFCLACGFPTAQAAEPQNTLRVMSFNIRYASADDGQNDWEHRKELVLETIEHFRPDLLGTQETEARQKDFLAAHLPEYTAFGVGRDDGLEKGEMMAVFYRTDRFTKLEGGHFWLSQTPEVAGSKSWDSSLPRMATWLKLQDKWNPSQPPLWFFNTHFDHRGPEARAEAGRIIHDRIAALPGSPVVVLTGDFNSVEASLPYKNLFAAAGDHPLLRDAFREVHPERTKAESTYNNFDPATREGGRIDWIGVTDQLRIESVEINRSSKNGRLPSDHFPLEAVLKYAH